jgi:hypothetical protein
MTGTQEGEPRPVPAVGQRTTSELRQRRKEIEHALKDKDKDIGQAPIAADLRASLKAITDEQDTRAAAEAESRERERALRLKREGKGPAGVHPDALLRVGHGG